MNLNFGCGSLRAGGVVVVLSLLTAACEPPRTPADGGVGSDGDAGATVGVDSGEEAGMDGGSVDDASVDSGVVDSGLDDVAPGVWRTERIRNPLPGARGAWVTNERELWAISGFRLVRHTDTTSVVGTIEARSLGVNTRVWLRQNREPWIIVESGKLQRFDGTTLRTEFDAGDRSLRVITSETNELWLYEGDGVRRWNGTSFDPPVNVLPDCALDNGDLVYVDGANIMLRRLTGGTAIITPAPDASPSFNCSGRSLLLRTAALGHSPEFAVVDIDTGARRTVMPVFGGYFTNHRQRISITSPSTFERISSTHEVTPGTWASPLPIESNLIEALDMAPDSNATFIRARSGAVYVYRAGAWQTFEETLAGGQLWGRRGGPPLALFAAQSWARRDATGAWRVAEYPRLMDDPAGRPTRTLVRGRGNEAYLRTPSRRLVQWSPERDFREISLPAFEGEVIQADAEDDILVQNTALDHWNGRSFTRLAPLYANKRDFRRDAMGNWFVLVSAVNAPPLYTQQSLHRFDGTMWRQVIYFGQAQPGFLEGQLEFDSRGGMWAVLTNHVARVTGSTSAIVYGDPMTNYRQLSGALIGDRLILSDVASPAGSGPVIVTIDTATSEVRSVSIPPSPLSTSTVETTWISSAEHIWAASGGAVQRLDLAP
ncbi:MAG: hypothetical protein JNK05_28695 [Myxococcales bacterium]|nr:hypothetical protein [Myxococcales bacterium]